MRLEDEALAKDVDYNNDVIISNAAMVETPIKDPRTRPLLRLELRGPINDGHVFNDDRQKMTAAEGHFLFEGRTYDMAGFQAAKLPIADEAVKPWLAATQFVQSDNPKLIAKAKEIIGDETDALAASTKLSKWVHENMHSTFSARLTNAIEVLEHLEGDCTEHSILFIGLARAAGLPAREVAGVVYVEGVKPGFYFHQWAKVWVGKWVDVDPTFDQPLVDATHIKLAEGDLFQQARIIPIIGQLQIKEAAAK
jgi:transglutaminase-like putative cysteine protease